MKLEFGIRIEAEIGDMDIIIKHISLRSQITCTRVKIKETKHLACHGIFNFILNSNELKGNLSVNCETKYNLQVKLLPIIKEGRLEVLPPPPNLFP